MRSGGKDRRAVMGRQVPVRRVEFGFVEAGGGDAALQVVRNQQSRTTVEVLEGPYMAANPVRQALAPGGFAVGVVRSAQNGDEDRGLPNFAGHRVGDRHCRAGVVDEELLARGVRLAQAHRQPHDPLPIVGAEPAVVVALWVIGLVFLPEQVECHPFTPQFAVHDRPIRFGTTQARRRRRWVKLRLQPLLTHSGRQWPSHLAQLRPAEDLANRRRRNLHYPSDLAMAQATLVREP